MQFTKIVRILKHARPETEIRALAPEIRSLFQAMVTQGKAGESGGKRGQNGGMRKLRDCRTKQSGGKTGENGGTLRGRTVARGQEQTGGIQTSFFTTRAPFLQLSRIIPERHQN
eukprot:4336861-Lingulodinium_polyedra.AAC.1